MNRRAWAVAGAIGVAGAALSALLAALDPARAAFAWLTAFVFWVGIAVGAICLVCAFHLTGAKWPTVFRRTVETLGLGVIPLAALSLPLAFALPLLFSWMRPPGELPHHALAALEHKRAWLDAPFFLVRAAVYFAVWITMAVLFHSWSTRQDVAGGISWTVRLRTLSGPAAPLLVLTMSFAAFDWVMSLNPLWQSTMFGLYVLAGGFVAALALVALVLCVRGPASLVNTDHLHAVGKLLHSFTCMWAYIAFSQGMLVWIANLPEEAPWYLVRTGGGWQWIGVFLILAHFAIPFFALLPRESKRRRGRLGAIAALVLLAHYADVYWLVLPALHPEGPAPGAVDLAALAGVGGLAAAFVLGRASRVEPIPLRDPYLLQSLEYRS